MGNIRAQAFVFDNDNYRDHASNCGPHWRWFEEPLGPFYMYATIRRCSTCERQPYCELLYRQKRPFPRPPRSKEECQSRLAGAAKIYAQSAWVADNDNYRDHLEVSLQMVTVGTSGLRAGDGVPADDNRHLRLEQFWGSVPNP